MSEAIILRQYAKEPMEAAETAKSRAERAALVDLAHTYAVAAAIMAQMDRPLMSVEQRAHVRVAE